MNDGHSERELDDQSAAHLLSALKQIEPSVESRVANRSAVAAEILRMTRQTQERKLPVWRRTVVVPWPIAAGVLAVLIMLSLMLFHSDRDVPSLDGTSVVEQVEDDTNRQRTRTEVTAVTRPPSLAYHETATYLCGIGQLHTEVRYFYEE